MADTATRLNEDLKNAMRAKDGMALNTLRAVKSAIKNAAIEKGGSDTELEEGETEALQGTMRERMVAHREKALCKSCHQRMDPIGLALENFNAIGQWRDEEEGQPIDSAGQLITGEKFSNVMELKEILSSSRKEDFYRCLTEKMLTYAVGRGVEYYDAPAVDRIVDRLLAGEGQMVDLIYGVVESTPFQKRRGDGDRLQN